jgi:gamma-F420-2:alpha-L-glutamate ligase
VLVVNGKAVAAMERKSCDGSFKSNISLGGIGTRFDLPDDMAELAVKVSAVLGLDVAGVDILFDEKGYRVCEANSSPGFQGLEKACNVSVPELIFAAMRERLGLPARPRGHSWRRFIGSLRKSLGRRKPLRNRMEATDPVQLPP